MDGITFTSVLERSHRRPVENLLFLNPGQHRVRGAILEAIEKHGLPRLVEEAGRLRVRLDSGQEVQTLFAVRHTAQTLRVAGAMVYTRLDSTAPDIRVLENDRFSPQFGSRVM